MKSKNQHLFDLLMYAILLVFFIYWFTKDHMPLSYLWTIIILYIVIIVFKLKAIFSSKK